MTSPTTSASGLLSGVLNFVSREFEVFVASATGNAQFNTLQPESPQLESRNYQKTKTVVPTNVRRVPSKQKRDLHRRKRAERRPLFAEHSQEESIFQSSDDEVEIVRAPGDRDNLSQIEGDLPSCSVSRQRKVPSRKCYSPQNSLGPSEPQKSSSSQRRSISTTASRHHKSVNMPGSFFPRSPSIMPHSPSPPTSFSTITTTNERHVHFNGNGETRVQLPSSPVNASEALSERPHSAHTESSVKAAVERFRLGEDDADPSILLPSPNNSPYRMSHVRDRRNRERIRDHSPSPSGISWKVDDEMGRSKENAIVIDDEDQRIKEEDASSDLRVRGIEQELAAAREQQQRNEKRRELQREQANSDMSVLRHEEEAEQERAKDKERIRVLEEEIARLREELSKRPIVSLPSLMLPPPPPPPPPPPRTLISLSLGSQNSSSTLFASARLALKHAPPPVEAPINPPHPSKHQGLPTVGIPPDKMAAFLNEMKTVRLRKVGKDLSMTRSEAARRGEPSLSIVGPPALTDNAYSSLTNSTGVGGKRKRSFNNIAFFDYQNDLHVAIRRRSLPLSDSSLMSSTNTSTSSAAGSSSSFTSLSQLFPPSSNFEPAIHNAKPLLPESIGTPSLCSDNDNEREIPEMDDNLPSTPPVVPPFRNVFRFRGTGIPVETPKDVQSAVQDCLDGKAASPLEEHSEAITDKSDDIEHAVNEKDPTNDVVKLMKKGVRSPSRENSAGETDPFKKRLPTSPLPLERPVRKPRRPMRRPPTPHTKLFKHFLAEGGKRGLSDEDDDDPLSLKSSSAGATRLDLSPSPAGNMGDDYSLRPAYGSKTGQSTHRTKLDVTARVNKEDLNTRQTTLDVELKEATDAQLVRDYNEDESEFFSGTGSRNHRLGFLAHGGAGGAPVFMGVGYMQGVEREEQQSYDLES